MQYLTSARESIVSAIMSQPNTLNRYAHIAAARYNLAQFCMTMPIPNIIEAVECAIHCGELSRALMPIDMILNVNKQLNGRAYMPAAEIRATIDKVKSLY